MACLLAVASHEADLVTLSRICVMMIVRRAFYYLLEGGYRTSPPILCDVWGSIGKGGGGGNPQAPVIPPPPPHKHRHTWIYPVFSCDNFLTYIRDSLFSQNTEKLNL